VITVDKMKSAYEIAMEKAEEISKDVEGAQDRLSMRDEIKPILSQYYRDDIDADGLWQEFKERDQKLLKEAQKMILEALGLRTNERDLEKKKEAVLALESLKNNGKSTQIERSFQKIQKLQERHTKDREKIQEQLERELNNSEMQMKQVETEDGQQVMKMEPGLDRETQQKFQKAISQTEAQYSEQFDQFIEELKNQL